MISPYTVARRSPASPVVREEWDYIDQMVREAERTYVNPNPGRMGPKRSTRKGRKGEGVTKTATVKAGARVTCTLCDSVGRALARTRRNMTREGCAMSRVTGNQPAEGPSCGKGSEGGCRRAHKQRDEPGTRGPPSPVGQGGQ